MRVLAASVALLSIFAGSAQAHEVICGDKAGALCGRWSRNFAGGPVSSGMPDMVGTVTVSLQIDPTGHISGCAVEQSSGSPVVDSETCRQLRDYAHYRAALDDAGQPTVGADQLTIEWVFHQFNGATPTEPDSPADIPAIDPAPLDPSTLI